MENFNPQDCIAGKISRLQRQITHIFRKHIRSFGVTTSQLSLLFVLFKRTELSQKELAEIAVLEKSSLKRNIDLIIKNGWAEPGLGKKVSLTPSGKKLVIMVLPSWQQAMKTLEMQLGQDGLAALKLLESKF
ncbi:MAG: winged helix-turn-helix transcriptional regulator [Saprospiraceae bacterium]|nr:winged helix-turn-helix transcriptional regulator [Saprospiraceae bacterium]